MLHTIYVNLVLAKYVKLSIRIIKYQFSFNIALMLYSFRVIENNEQIWKVIEQIKYTMDPGQVN